MRARACVLRCVCGSGGRGVVEAEHGVYTYRPTETETELETDKETELEIETVIEMEVEMEIKAKIETQFNMWKHTNILFKVCSISGPGC